MTVGKIPIGLKILDQVNSWMVGNPYLIALRQSCPSLARNHDRGTNSLRRQPTDKNCFSSRTAVSCGMFIRNPGL